MKSVRTPSGDGKVSPPVAATTIGRSVSLWDVVGSAAGADYILGRIAAEYVLEFCFALDEPAAAAPAAEAGPAVDPRQLDWTRQP